MEPRIQEVPASEGTLAHWSVECSRCGMEIASTMRSSVEIDAAKHEAYCSAKASRPKRCVQHGGTFSPGAVRCSEWYAIDETGHSDPCFSFSFQPTHGTTVGAR